jgi:hypothetical protein
MRSEHGVPKFAILQVLKKITLKSHEVAKEIREDPETWLSLSLLWQSISLLTSTPSKIRVFKPNFVPFILFTKSFYKMLKTHSSFFNCVRINCNRSQLIVAAYLLSKIEDFGFADAWKHR